MIVEESVEKFDVNGPGIQDKLFGLPFSPENAKLIIIPVPWEATVSYRTGTALAPHSILKASRQIDFFMRDIPEAWKLGIAMLPIPDDIRIESDRLRLLLEQHHAALTEDHDTIIISNKINESCESLNIYVNKTTQRYIDQGKMVGLLGGDHSTPLGFLRSLSEKHDRFGILQFDAHADLRKSYEGLTYSHGSIMFNALKIPAISKLVQVGVRDLCDEEYQLIKRNESRIKTFFDDNIKADLGNGKSWESICKDIIRDLPEKVYISFDIDGLDPKLCPNTGTPVPGGLEFYQATFLIKAVVASGRRIIGFDLNEVGTDESSDWDANVGARILWQLCNWMGVSNKR
ncbi:MAG: agmatinase family protein [Cyclobacteriaceae bacterium]|nr:agmatinase family protein [Cyclobacteriaceae bacterium]